MDVGTCEACERNRLAANGRSVPWWLNCDTTGIVADGVEAVEIANSAADLYGDPIMADLWQIESLSSVCRLNA